jgi:hypothetical protein
MHVMSFQKVQERWMEIFLIQAIHQQYYPAVLQHRMSRAVVDSFQSLPKISLKILQVLWFHFRRSFRYLNLALALTLTLTISPTLTLTLTLTRTLTLPLALTLTLTHPNRKLLTSFEINMNLLQHDLEPHVLFYAGPSAPLPPDGNVLISEPQQNIPKSWDKRRALTHLFSPSSSSRKKSHIDGRAPLQRYSTTRLRFHNNMCFPVWLHRPSPIIKIAKLGKTVLVNSKKKLKARRGSIEKLVTIMYYVFASGGRDPIWFV